MLAKKTSKNQLTLPKDVVKEFPGIDYFNVTVKNGTIILSPVFMKSAVTEISGIRGKMEKLGISEDIVKTAVQWARKGKK